ncbi:MAG TPA: hypothetical protein VHN82_08570 [Methanoregula sp.]|nr:hypothetical protein [Methanoregula sp.]
MKKKDLEPLIFRWKKTTRALKAHEQLYGMFITDILEAKTDAELARFSDPVEAAVFFCLLELAKRCWAEDPGPRAGTRGQSTLLSGYGVS